MQDDAALDPTALDARVGELAIGGAERFGLAVLRAFSPFRSESGRGRRCGRAPTRGSLRAMRSPAQSDRARLIVGLCLVFLAVGGLGLVWLRDRASARYQHDLDAGLDALPEGVLDLREVGGGDWDELAVWHPYEDLCALGIRGLSPGSKACRTSTDDGDCELLFLRRGELAGRARVDRRRSDFARASLPPRLPRAAARFRLARTEFARPLLFP